MSRNEPPISSGGEHRRQRERERRADQDLLEGEHADAERVARQLLTLRDHPGETDGDRDGDDPLDLRRDLLGREQRRDHEQRRHPHEHEEEAEDVVARDLPDELREGGAAHQLPTIVGIALNRSAV